MRSDLSKENLDLGTDRTLCRSGKDPRKIPSQIISWNNGLFFPKRISFMRIYKKIEDEV